MALLCFFSIPFALLAFCFSSIWAYSNQQLEANVDVEYEPHVSFNVTADSQWKLTNLKQFNNSSTSTTLGSVNAGASNTFTVSPVTISAGTKLVYEVMITPSKNTSLTITFSDDAPMFANATVHYNNTSSVASPCSKSSWGTQLTASGNTYSMTIKNKKNNYFYIVIHNTGSSALTYIADWVIR